MKILRTIATLLMLGAFLGSPAFAHGKHKMVCKKDDKVIKVKGKNEDEKKAKCAEKGGAWQEADEE